MVKCLPKVGPVLEMSVNLNAGLRNHQRIGWWRRNALGNVRLEIDDACMGQVNVFSPTCNNWVRFNSRVTIFLKEREERFSHLRETELSICSRIAKESVASALIGTRFTAGFLLGILCPEIFSAFWTMLPNETFLFKEWKSVICFCKLLGQLQPLQLCCV